MQTAESSWTNFDTFFFLDGYAIFTNILPNRFAFFITIFFFADYLALFSRNFFAFLNRYFFTDFLVLTMLLDRCFAYLLPNRLAFFCAFFFLANHLALLSWNFSAFLNWDQFADFLGMSLTNLRAVVLCRFLTRW